MPHTPCLSARPAAVAGRFYPDDPQALRSVLAQSLRKAVVSEPDERPVRALIAPHAGYVSVSYTHLTLPTIYSV